MKKIITINNKLETLIKIKKFWYYNCHTKCNHNKESSEIMLMKNLKERNLLDWSFKT